ncbi:MAG: GNAT family N-acetyltransferase [Chitinophagales bacterium]|nr:GNAT family N-acetyltransferase [Chitinophagales bacterium]MCZ2394393.1 GNAT family N-acetyltransferase [Chitinophagales bacterium]
MKIEIAPFNSSLYKQALTLRNHVLLKPWNLVFTPTELEEEKNQVHIVAVEEGEVLGVVILKELDSSTVKMRQLAVKEKDRGQGIGSELVAFFEEYALENGYTQIELHARERAVRFYTQLDYERIGEVFKEVTLNHYKMVKNLE